MVRDAPELGSLRSAWNLLYKIIQFSLVCINEYCCPMYRGLSESTVSILVPFSRFLSHPAVET